MSAKIRIGLSGYAYKTWQGEGRFYPPEVKSGKFLQYFASRFDTVEINGTWRTMPTESSVAGWLKEVPKDFVFSPKIHQKVSHLTRLKPESIEVVKEFIKPLEALVKTDQLGPILIQLPPNMKRDDDRLASFVKEIPHQVRYAIEFRHDSWNADEVAAILAEKNIAWVASDQEDSPAVRRETADFTYARLRKDDYTSEDLAEWANYFRGLKDCFIYVRHTDEGSPWLWAEELKRNLES